MNTNPHRSCSRPVVTISGGRILRSTSYQCLNTPQANGTGTYYRSRLQNGMERGFHFDDVVFLKGGLSVASGSSIVTNNIGFWTFSSTSYLAHTTTNGRAGMALGGSGLIIGSQGTWVDFNQIRAICAAISNRRVFLPASSGGLSSWWDVTIPSMTTWST